METLDATELLNFTLEEELENTSASYSHQFPNSSDTASFSHETGQTGSLPELVEEDLEWLSNKDAFPAVETCFGILSDNPELIINHQSPVSVLDNSNNNSNNTNSNSNSTFLSCFDSLKVPTVRTRSKRSIRKRRTSFGDLTNQLSLWLNPVNVKNCLPPPLPTKTSSGKGRRCLHCQSDQTPQWRAGPMGPKTLCNACGVRYKSGRLVPEYRPASSPTFSSALHSNSHRKVVEMRKQKQRAMGFNDACAYSLE